MKTFGDNAYTFFSRLDFNVLLPKDVAVMNPYRDAAIQAILKNFLTRFYSDATPRVFIWGINPGRHGGGLTGLPFTDPYALRVNLGISHTIAGRREPSAEYVYTVIEAFGGVEKFYKAFYINSLCPLGFTKSKINFNFYDDPDFYRRVKPFIVASMKTQIGFGAKCDAAICLGTGKLYKVFLELNAVENFFDRIIPLEHPRFIMQYRRKTMADYLKKYLDVFNDLL